MTEVKTQTDRDQMDRDMTSRIEELERALALTSRLGRIIEQSINEIFIFDAETLYFTQVNKGARDNLGYTLEELQGMKPFEIKPHYDFKQFTDLLEPLKNGEQNQLIFETVHQRKDRTVYDVEIHLQLMREETPPAYVAIILDITNRKRDQAQLIQSSKLASLGEMATEIAHEINQPLNIIRMSADALAFKMGKQDHLPPEFEQASQTAIQRITDQVIRAANIIERVRIFGRNPAKEHTKIFVHEAVESITNLLTDQLRIRNIALKLDVQDGCRPVMGDLIELEQVIVNLIVNARDAILSNNTDAQGTAVPGRIMLWVEESLAHDQIHIVVEDNGGGIPNAILDKIFDPFFTTKEVAIGTGVGLSVSYRIVDSMNGSISAANIDGGARFTLSLPVVN